MRRSDRASSVICGCTSTVKCSARRRARTIDSVPDCERPSVLANISWTYLGSGPIWPRSASADRPRRSGSISARPGVALGDGAAEDQVVQSGDGGSDD